MTKEVRVSIRGGQSGSEEEPVTITAPGIYHLTNGRHYIQYDEISSENAAVTKNSIKIAPDKIILTRKGAQSSQMEFDLKEQTQSVYQTPYGTIALDIITKSIKINENESTIDCNLEYSLYTDSSLLSDNSIMINITAKE